MIFTSSPPLSKLSFDLFSSEEAEQAAGTAAASWKESRETHDRLLTGGDCNSCLGEMDPRLGSGARQ